MEDRKKNIPLWLPNTLVFITLFLMITLYFFWQIRAVERSFLAHVGQHADMVSKIVQLNAAGSIDARRSIEDLLHHLLGNTARFVSYLETIEPFVEDELEAFARESGLEGITIVKQGTPIYPGTLNAAKKTETEDAVDAVFTVHSSDRWRSVIEGAFHFDPLPSRPMLSRHESDALYILIWVDGIFPGAILLGIRNDTLAKATDRLGLKNTVNTMTTVPGITHITITAAENGATMEKETKDGPDHRLGQPVETDISSRNWADMESASTDQGRHDDPGPMDRPAMILHHGKEIAQSSQIIQGMRLTVGVDADYKTRFIHRLTLHFYLFSLFLILAGLFLSIILFRYQKRAVHRLQRYERALSSQREEASLGRSAAAIAHEIRNPLNSLSMGLQRLTLENACSSAAHVKLIRQMSDAVVRANGSVTGLLTYARPRIPNIRPICPATLLTDILALYTPACQRFAIDVQTDIVYRGTMESDGDLLGQVFENIIKNSVEAQPEGGYLHCRINLCTKKREGKRAFFEALEIQFKNGHCDVAPDHANKILEPYFTTRADGTGLGMAIVGSIIKSLQGDITIHVNDDRAITITIYLPLHHSNRGRV